MVSFRLFLAFCYVIGTRASRTQVIHGESIRAGTSSDVETQQSSNLSVCFKKEFTKYYDFAAVTLGGTTSDNSVSGIAAVKLELTKTSALMFAYPAHHWRAELEEPYKKDDSQMRWMPISEGTQSPAAVVDLFQERNQVRYFCRKAIDDAPELLEIHYNDGTVDTLQGGVYYNEPSVKAAILTSSYKQHNTGVGASAENGKFEKASGEDFEKIAKVALNKCINRKKCMGFQYNPQQKVCEEKCFRKKCKWVCSSTLVHFLETPSTPVGAGSAGMFGPVKCPSEKRSCEGFVPTPLTQWRSTMYTPVNSEGLELKPKNTFKSTFGKAKTHVMSKESVGDAIKGNGKIAHSAGGIGSAKYDSEQVQAYRRANLIASERLWGHLQCLGWKTCVTNNPKASEILAPADKPCPHFG